MVNSKPRSRRRLDLDERREKLLMLGRSLFGKYSYDDLSIADIAKLAGMSKGLLYHYFPTKREFYIETVRAAANEILEVSQPSAALSSRKRLLHSLDSYLKYVEENASAYVSLMKSGIGVDGEVAEIVEQARRSFIERIGAELGLKKMKPTQRLALKGWVGFVEAVSLEWLNSKALGKTKNESSSILTRTELARFLARQFELLVLNMAPRALLKGFLK